MNELCLRGHRPATQHDGTPRRATRIDLADQFEAVALEMLRLSRELRTNSAVGDTYYLQVDVHEAATTLEAFASSGLLTRED